MALCEQPHVREDAARRKLCQENVLDVYWNVLTALSAPVPSGTPWLSEVYIMLHWPYTREMLVECSDNYESISLVFKSKPSGSMRLASRWNEAAVLKAMQDHKASCREPRCKMC